MINLLSQITANYFLAKPRATGIYVKMEVREHIFVPLGNGTLFLGCVWTGTSPRQRHDRKDAEGHCNPE